MTFGAEIWGPPLIAAGANWLANKGSASKETKMQKTQRKLVDQLINSLTGQGAFSDLYNVDEEAFNKSFVEPAQAKFRNQIAPQIQQQYIASGQQRGTGLDDTLTRAGVDLDSMLNQYLYQSQQDAFNRKQNTINSILGAGTGAANKTTGLQDALSGFSGYLASDNFSDQFSDYIKPAPGSQSKAPQTPPPRKGFTPEWSDWKLGDPRWGQS
jgi:hypothetical protein